MCRSTGNKTYVQQVFLVYFHISLFIYIFIYTYIFIHTYLQTETYLDKLLGRLYMYLKNVCACITMTLVCWVYLYPYLYLYLYLYVSIYRVRFCCLAVKFTLILQDMFKSKNPSFVLSVSDIHT